MANYSAEGASPSLVSFVKGALLTVLLRRALELRSSGTGDASGEESSCDARCADMAAAMAAGAQNLAERFKSLSDDGAGATPPSGSGAWQKVVNARLAEIRVLLANGVAHGLTDSLILSCDGTFSGARVADIVEAVVEKEASRKAAGRSVFRAITAQHDALALERTSELINSSALTFSPPSKKEATEIPAKLRPETPAAAAAAAAWDRKLTDSVGLEAYAAAATAMGDKSWVRGGMDWAARAAVAFFFQGGWRWGGELGLGGGGDCNDDDDDDDDDGGENSSSGSVSSDSGRNCKGGDEKCVALAAGGGAGRLKAAEVAVRRWRKRQLGRRARTVLECDDRRCDAPGGGSGGGEGAWSRGRGDSDLKHGSGSDEGDRLLALMLELFRDRVRAVDAQKMEARGAAGSTHKRKLKLLDIGSCYNPFIDEVTNVQFLLAPVVPF